MFQRRRTVPTGSRTMCGASVDEYAFAYWQYPSCELMYELEVDMNSLKDFMRFAPYGPHGSIHALIGGTLNCADTFDALEALGYNATAVTRLRSVVFNGLKNMFREGHLEFPANCTIGTPYSECHATCKNLDAYIASDNATMLTTYLDLIDFWGFFDDEPYSNMEVTLDYASIDLIFDIKFENSKKNEKSKIVENRSHF